MPTYYVDLTPFIPLIVDGQAHDITLDVVSAEQDHSINQNWYVTANLQVVLDSSNKPTTGKMSIYSAEPFARATTTGSTSHGDIDFTVKASRDIHIESEVVSGSGKPCRFTSKSGENGMSLSGMLLGGRDEENEQSRAA